MRGELHITPEPETYGTACPPRLAVSFGRGRRELTVVAELHEDSFVDRVRLRAALEEFRGWGWRVAVADVADCAEAVEAMGWVRPDYVQVDLARPGRAVPTPGVRRVLDAADTGAAAVIALGVDSERDRACAVALGATFGRGRHLGPPGPLPPF
jgi:EAL domain-containing protein (putative c-di-GMP-specific phosphodiesterase class I)